MYLSRKKLAIWSLTGLFFLLGVYYISSSYSQEIPVLNYHQVNNQAHNLLTLSASEFEAQMQYLQEAGYHTISPQQLTDYLEYGVPLPSHPILITFDDGYGDNYQVAYPILQKYHFTATIFLITDFIGTGSRYLTWEQIREMHANGISFESHTASHISLPDAADEELRSQLKKSKEILEQHLGQKIEYLAYPGGFYNRRVIEFAKQAGYKAAFTITFGRDRRHCELFTLNRIPIFEGRHTFFHFWLRLKFTQIFAVLQSIKNFVSRAGMAPIAQLIYIP